MLHMYPWWGPLAFQAWRCCTARIGSPRLPIACRQTTSFIDNSIEAGILLVPIACTFRCGISIRCSCTYIHRRDI